MDGTACGIAQRRLQQGADAQIPCAMTALGDALMRAVTIPSDYGRARTLFEDAESLGDHDATANLALMALYGIGEPKNEKKALQLLEEAASAGSLKACVMAFKNYTQGQGGIAPDPARAEEWRSRAEALGACGVDWKGTGQHQAAPPAAWVKAQGGVPPSLKDRIDAVLGLKRKGRTRRP